MLKKEYKILLPFAGKPWKKFTFKEVKKLTKNKSESYVYGSLNSFVKDGILKRETLGNAVLYSLNMDEPKAGIYAGFALEYHARKKRHIPYKDIKKIADKIPYKNYIFIITGSYARGGQKKTSDMDVVVLIGDSCKPKKVYAELSQTCELNIPQIHLYVFKHSEFVEMLSNKEANYGKEAVKNCLVLTEGQVYLKLIKEAVENGLNSKYFY